MFCRLTVIGNLGQDPRISTMPSGEQVCNFSVAHTKKWKDESGAEKERTMWIDTSVWGRQAESCSKYLFKGSKVFVEGEISLHRYTDKNGEQQTALKLSASTVKFLDSKKEQVAPSAADPYADLAPHPADDIAF